MSKVPPQAPNQINQGSSVGSLVSQSTTLSDTKAASSSGAQGQAGTSLQISGTSILPQLAKDLSMGDTISFTIRGRTPEGLGILYMLGQLVEAKIPDHLKTGDRVQALIGFENQQIIFKILSLTGPSSEASTQSVHFEKAFQNLTSLPDIIRSKVEEMLYKIAPFLPDNSQNIPHILPHHSSPLPMVNTGNETQGTIHSALIKILTSLEAIFPPDLSLTNGSDVFKNIQKLLSPGTTDALKVIQNEIATLLKENTASPEYKFLTTLIDQLSTLATKVENQQISNDAFKNVLERIFKAVEQEINKLASIPSKENMSTTLKIAFTMLKEIYTSPEPQEKSLSKVMQFLTDHLNQNNQNTFISQENQLSPRILKEVKTLLTSIEQFTQTQELLQRLEPILLAMKQPELLLFPFLFQGFFSFGELLVDPDAQRKDSGKKNDQEDEEQEDKEPPPNLQQFQAQIPLPNLGMVRFSSVQSGDEMELRLMFEDQERSDFINSEVSDLRHELQGLGFSKLEIITQGETENLLTPETPIKVM
jgi:hypothetical protein